VNEEQLEKRVAELEGAVGLAQGPAVALVAVSAEREIGGILDELSY